jgi:hypothetical protein
MSGINSMPDALRSVTAPENNRQKKAPDLHPGLLFAPHPET